MEEPVLGPLRSYIQLTHEWVLDAVVGLSTEQLHHRFGPTSPPLAWYLWHLARSADRFQASFSPRGDGNSHEPSNPNRDIWHVEGMAAKWKLDPSKLGILEAGTAMSHDHAAELAGQLDTIELLNYARRAFAAADHALASLTGDALLGDRTSIIEFQVDDHDGQHVVTEAPGDPTNHLADILFHFSHTSRHLGMIEALRSTFQMDGTVTI